MPPPHSRLKRFLPKLMPVEGWSFIMVAATAEAVSAFVDEVRASPKPFTTFAVWYCLGPYIRHDTGELTCSQRQLAKTAKVSVGDVQRAITRLVEMGVLLKEARGVYRVHPSVMWRGELAKRGQAEAGVPVLTLVEGGKATE